MLPLGIRVAATTSGGVIFVPLLTSSLIRSDCVPLDPAGVGAAEPGPWAPAWLRGAVGRGAADTGPRPPPRSGMVGTGLFSPGMIWAVHESAPARGSPGPPRPHAGPRAGRPLDPLGARPTPI